MRAFNSVTLQHGQNYDNEPEKRWVFRLDFKAL